MSRYRITLKMQQEGAKRMARCRTEPDHSPESVCAAIFVAMLDAADIHPGASVQASFSWSPHDPMRRIRTAPKRPAGRPKGQPWTREDFDEEGKRLVGMHANKPVYSYLKDIWYLRNKNTKP